MCTFTLPVFVLQSKAKSIWFEQSECILSNFPYTLYVWLCDIVCCVQNERDLQLTQMFNSMVLDFCDALWRNMIFKKKSKTSYPTLAFDLPRWALSSLSTLAFSTESLSLSPSLFLQRPPWILFHTTAPQKAQLSPPSSPHRSCNTVLYGGMLPPILLPVYPPFWSHSTVQWSIWTPEMRTP